MTCEYIVTIRKCHREGEEVIAHLAGVDLLLEENFAGNLFFPNDLFQDAKNLLIDAEKVVE